MMMMMMNLKEERGGARVCETCRAAACAVYCRADSAYLCSACDARVHGANRVASWHERVRVCEACERAPAAFLCKADAASLCSSCDADIHSANPLARRHLRIPILPVAAAAATLFEDDDDADDDEDEDHAEAASWLTVNNHLPSQGDVGFGFGGGAGAGDEYLDLVEFNNNNNSGGEKLMMNLMSSDVYGGGGGGGGGGDSVVPCSGDHLGRHHHHHHKGSIDVNMMFMMDENDISNDIKATLDFDLQSPDTKPGYGYSVSVSSMDASVVPDSSTMSEISVSHPRPPKGTIDLFSGPPVPMATQLTPLDREARVLRYREKKKNRKFEKTIRYASRKAYAETRPRIKGRFAKRTSVDVEVDQLFSTALMADTGYSIVPSF